MSKRAPSDSISRCFAVLEALGRNHSARLKTLVAETGLPQPTVVRYLKTLIRLGYVAQISRAGGYRLTDRLLELSGLIRFDDRLIDAARQPMSAFTTMHGWPLYLATSNIDSIRIRHSTARESPMNFEGEGINSKRSMLTSAIGRVWLAYCPSEEREAALKIVGEKAVLALPQLPRILAQIRRRGYAFSAPPKSRRIHGLAVPVMTGPQIAATLTMRFPKSVMTEEVAAQRFVCLLQEVAGTISRRLGQLVGES
jgi:IclR family mhp operon transcriptional activator